MPKKDQNKQSEKMQEDSKKQAMEKFEPTKEQRAAIEQTDGQVCVVAVPGSGKSTIIEKRVEYLITQKGVPAENIYVVTFTHVAAASLKERIKKNFTDDPLKSKGCFIGTFHSLCDRILEPLLPGNSGEAFGYLRNLQQEEWIKDIYKEYYDKKITRGEARSVHARIQERKKSYGPSSKDHYVQFFLDYKKEKQLNEYICMQKNDEDRIFYLYLKMQCTKIKQTTVLPDGKEVTIATQKLLDYEDIMQLALYQLLQKENNSYLHRQQEQCQYILCDEYQDVNENQDVLMRLLSAKHKNLTVVGDDDQNIYSWRGASYRFMKEFWETAEHKLTVTRNFRSSQAILEVAQCVISKNTDRICGSADTDLDKTIVAANPEGGKPVYFIHKAEEDEANWIAGQIQEKNHTDVAILVRQKKQSECIEKAFKKRNIPYTKVGGEGKRLQMELEAFCAFLKVIDKEDVKISEISDMLSATKGRLSKKKKNAFTEQILQLSMDYHARAKNVLDVVDEMSELFFDDGRKIETQDDNWGSAHYRVNGILRKRIIEESAIRCNANKYREKDKFVINDSFVWMPLADVIENFMDYVSYDMEAEKGVVQILTVHTAKGTEYDTVFIPGMVEGVFPSRVQEKSKYEEERRLFYVAITRAKRHLYISSYKKSGKYELETQLSSLLGDIDSKYLRSYADR